MLIEDLPSQVFSLLEPYKRQAPDAPCRASPCWQCAEAQRERVMAQARRGEPLTFVLPAFPAKSPNPRKVLGILPDEAERQALIFLEWLCVQLESIYPAGARTIVCSDGRVFGDCVGIPDANVTAYQEALGEMLKSYPHLTAYNLDDRWPKLPFDDMRRRLCEEYAEPLDNIRNMVREDENTKRLYRGITRFLFEDSRGVLPMSNTALQARARIGAYSVIQRSKAWGDLVSDVFPDAVRLSIHPQRCGASKFGIRLGVTPDVWLTPWHAVAVLVHGRFQLMKREEAEKRGATIVSVNGRPSYLSLPGTVLESPPPMPELAPPFDGEAAAHDGNNLIQ